MRAKKLIIFIFLVVAFFATAQAQQNVAAKDMLIRGRMMSFTSDTLIAPFSGTGYYYMNVRTGVNNLDAVNVQQLRDSIAANYGYDSLRFSTSS